MNILGSIFPGKKFCPIDLKSVADHSNLQNSLNVHPWTYTEYPEDRTGFFKGSYLETMSPAIHLGRDIQVPAGTLVRSPIRGFLMSNFVDPSNDIGWGRRIDIYDNSTDKYWIFGHLTSNPVLSKDFEIGDIIEIGDVIGMIGNINNNGGVFEHLHLQVCSPDIFGHKNIITEELDGYGDYDDLKYHFDPFSF